MKRAAICLLIIVLTASSSRGQTTPAMVNPILEVALQKPEVTRFQLINHLMGRVTPLRVPQTSKDWISQAKHLRRHLLEDIIFHGWPSEWITSRPRFEPIGAIISAEGYRIRRFRPELVPGFWSTALLYEPEPVRGKVPAILNLLGHYPQGKAMAFEQTRCINYAVQELVALDPE